MDAIHDEPLSKCSSYWKHCISFFSSKEFLYFPLYNTDHPIFLIIRVNAHYQMFASIGHSSQEGHHSSLELVSWSREHLVHYLHLHLLWPIHQVTISDLSPECPQLSRGFNQGSNPLELSVLMFPLQALLLHVGPV